MHGRASGGVKAWSEGEGGEGTCGEDGGVCWTKEVLCLQAIHIYIYLLIINKYIYIIGHFLASLLGPS